MTVTNTTPAIPRHPTVNCPPWTGDDDMGVGRSHDRVVTPLADLMVPGADVILGAPTDLGPCADCMTIDRVAVATVSWPDAAAVTGRDHIAVCRDCLPTAITAATDRVDITDRVEVEVPVWTPAELADAVGAVAWDAAWWNRVHGEPTSGGPRYLADVVDHARGVVR